jgi:hypothetical protein
MVRLAIAQPRSPVSWFLHALTQLLDLVFLRSVAFASQGLRCERIDLSLGKLSGWNPLFKQHIELSIRPIFGLRQSEIDPDAGQQTSPSPKESGAGAPVPRRRRKLVICHDVDEDVARIVSSSSQHDCLGFEASRRQFRDQAVGHRPYGEVVGECEDDQHSGDRPYRRIGSRERQAANDDQKKELAAQSAEMDLAAPDPCHQEPGPCRSNNSEG